MILTGKVSFITGGASGIGLACAKEFLSGGVKAVTLVDINEVDGEKVSKQLNEIYPNKVIFIKANVSDKTQLKEAFEKTVQTFGNLDIVLNNAGVANEIEPSKCYDVNIVGVTNCLQLALEDFLPKFKSKSSEGIIINVSSLTGLYPRNWFMIPAYSASKCAVLGLTMCYGHPFYNEISGGVKVIAVCPGKTVSPLVNNIKELEVNHKEEFLKLVDVSPSQKADELAKNLVEVIGKASNGSVWLMEGGLFEEIDFVRKSN